MNKPLISIIIPTYNRAHLLGETLNSIIAQTYINWECIIVDDGSNDNSEKLVQSYINKDNRFQFHKRPNNTPKGANPCRNYGFELSKGDYINWFDSDDIMHQSFLKKKLDVLLANKELDFCACISITFKTSIENTIEVVKPKILNSFKYLEDYLLNGLSFFTPSPLWRKRFLENKLLFDETLFRAQESDFHFRMLTYKPEYKYLEDILFYVRSGEDSITTNAGKSLKAQQSVFKYFDKTFQYIYKSDEKRKETLLRYIAYRQLVNYFNINSLSKNILSRFMLCFKYFKKIMSYSFKAKLGFKKKLKITFGLFLVVFLAKGYKFFYYPEYNARNAK